MLAGPATLRARKADKNNEGIWPESEWEALYSLSKYHLYCYRWQQKNPVRGAI